LIADRYSFLANNQPPVNPKQTGQHEPDMLQLQPLDAAFGGKGYPAEVGDQEQQPAIR